MESDRYKLSDHTELKVHENGLADLYYGGEILYKDINHPVLTDGVTLYYEENNFIYRLYVTIPYDTRRVVMDSCIPYGVEGTVVYADERTALLKKNNSTEYILIKDGEYIANADIGEELEFYFSSDEVDYAISSNNDLYKVIIGKEPFTLRFFEVAKNVDSVNTVENFSLVLNEDDCCIDKYGTKLLEFQKEGENFIVVPKNGATIENEGFHGLEHPIREKIGYQIVEAQKENYDFVQLNNSAEDHCFNKSYGIIVDSKFLFRSNPRTEDAIKRNYIAYVAERIDTIKGSWSKDGIYQKFFKMVYRVSEEQELIDSVNRAFSEYEKAHSEEIKNYLLSTEGDSVLSYDKLDHIPRKWEVKEFLEEHPEIEISQYKEDWAVIDEAGKEVEPITAAHYFWTTDSLPAGKYKISVGVEMEVQEDEGDLYINEELKYEDISHPVADKNGSLYFAYENYVYKLQRTPQGIEIKEICHTVIPRGLDCSIIYADKRTALVERNDTTEYGLLV